MSVHLPCDAGFSWFLIPLRSLTSPLLCPGHDARYSGRGARGNREVRHDVIPALRGLRFNEREKTTPLESLLWKSLLIFLHRAFPPWNGHGDVSFPGITSTSAFMLLFVDATSGSSRDWARDIGIPFSYTFELRDNGTYGFVLPEAQIQATCEESMAAILSVLDDVYEKYWGVDSAGKAASSAVVLGLLFSFLSLLWAQAPHAGSAPVTRAWLQPRCLAIVKEESNNLTKDTSHFNKDESRLHFHVCFAGDQFLLL